MPELPEVQTTVNGLKRHIIGLQIADVWSNYDSAYFEGSGTVKDRAYFRYFRKEIIGKRVASVERRAKNILINLERTRSAARTILVHMKMTGHLLYGAYRFDAKNKKDPWRAVSPVSLKDPFNRHVRFLISFKNKKHLALSDVRKFAKVALVDTDTIGQSGHLGNIGPEPLDPSFTYEKFVERLQSRENGKVKQVLMDQSIIAGIGNIYADESLWRAGINPSERVAHIGPMKLKHLYSTVKKTLSRGIDFGGDSTSDYRNIRGEKGAFHEQHHVYRRTGDRCDKRGCGGTIVRVVLGGRGTHLCDRHQRLRGGRK